MGTYKVQGNGKAQSGLSAGDKVVTGGGTYEITGVKADGTYESKLVDKNTTTKNYTGSYSSGSSSKGSSSGSSGGSSGTSQRDRDNETISKPGGTLYYDDGRAAVHNAGKAWQDGVDYAAEAAKYAAAGDWGGVNDVLMRREAKINDLGITGVQSNLEVWKELNDKYNGPSAGKSLAEMQAGAEKAYGSSVKYGDNSVESDNYYFSSAYQDALAMLQAAQKNMPTYKNSYESQLKDIYDQIVNRDKFQYDINSDMLYQQYAQQYQNNGRLAMQDTMGQAAALTGGYGSSYGQAVGQQQYDAYLQDLNDVIPELYSQAYQQYSDEGDKMIQQYSMLGDLADREYQLYSDEYDRWYAETQAALSQYNADRNFNYQKEQADRDYQFNLDKFNYSKEQADREYQLALDKFAYQKQKDKKINPTPTPDPTPEPTYYNSLLGAISTAKGASSKGNYQTRSATYTESVNAINDALSAGKITKEEATALKRAAIPAAR